MDKVRVPLADEFLGRERVYAKKTRLACHSAVERFEDIVECAALWHAKQLSNSQRIGIMLKLEAIKTTLSVQGQTRVLLMCFIPLYL